MRLMRLAFIFTTLFCLQVSVAQESSAARALILKGKVYYHIEGSESPVVLKEGDLIPIGASIKTEEKSYTKILFADKSSLTVGPKTEVVITSFPKNQAGIISLIKGQIRSRVTKDYMEIENKNQSKLFIKTKTAALGIRGTDFQVNYNEENQNSSLITFEGRVVMASIDKTDREADLNQVRLEELVSGPKSVAVEGGYVSAVNNNLSARAMLPTKMGTKQLEALKNFEYGDNKTADKKDEKHYRSPIPPGADGVTFSNIKPEVIQAQVQAQAQAQGFFNTRTGEYKLPDGVIIDLKTVNIIPPPAHAVFDSNTKTFIVPEEYGKVDRKTGEYLAPVGLELSANGKFRILNSEQTKKDEAAVKEEKREEKRDDDKREAYAHEDDIVSMVIEGDHHEEAVSAEIKPEFKPDVAKLPRAQAPKREISSVEVAASLPKGFVPPKLYEGFQVSDFANRNADPLLRSSVVAPETFGTVIVSPDLSSLANDRKISTETLRQNITDQGILLVPTKVNFKLNVK